MRFVSPETVRIDLSDGHWIEVKKHLNIYEKTKMRSDSFKAVRKDDRDGAEDVQVVLDWARMPFARVEAYLVGWSATDDGTMHGKPVKLSRAAIENLSEDAFKEIDEAIQQHIQAVTEGNEVTAS